MNNSPRALCESLTCRWMNRCNTCLELMTTQELDKVINAIKVSIDSTNPEETELIINLYKAIELLEKENA